MTTKSFKEQFIDRTQRVILTFNSKKWLCWFFISALFVMYGIEKGWWGEYLLYTIAVSGVDVVKDKFGLTEKSIAGTKKDGD